MTALDVAVSRKTHLTEAELHCRGLFVGALVPSQHMHRHRNHFFGALLFPEAQLLLAGMAREFTISLAKLSLLPG